MRDVGASIERGKRVLIWTMPHLFPSTLALDSALQTRSLYNSNQVFLLSLPETPLSWLPMSSSFPNPMANAQAHFTLLRSII